MLTKGNLRLISTQASIAVKKSRLNIFKEFFSNIIISRTEKILILKEYITNMYRDYEITTGEADIPYFVKAEKKIAEIIAENKLDYYYKKLKKFQSGQGKLNV